MKKWPFTRASLWGAAGVLAVFAVGLIAGTFLLRAVFPKTEPAAVPNLSEVAAPPEAVERLPVSALPPVGLSPVPVEAPQAPGVGDHGTGPEPPAKIPWAEPYPAPSFTLTDHDGKTVSLRDFLGKVVLVNFIYTNCKTVCPVETQELKTLQEALGPLMGKDVAFLSITIDPKRDTPEVLKRYGEGHAVQFRSWRFLTGPDKAIRRVLEAYRVPVQVEKRPGDPRGSYELGHGNPIYLIDQWGRVRKRTAPTMLVQIGRPAIEWLVKQGAADPDAGADHGGRRSRPGR